MSTHSYEERIMDLADQGMAASDIARETGFSFKTVQGVIHRLTVRGTADAWTVSAKLSSDALARALRRHHPERCGA